MYVPRFLCGARGCYYGKFPSRSSQWQSLTGGESSHTNQRAHPSNCFPLCCVPRSRPLVILPRELSTPAECDERVCARTPLKAP